MRGCSGQRIGAAVDRPGLNFFLLSHTKRLKDSKQGFLAWRSAQKRKCGRKVSKLAGCVFEMASNETLPFLGGRQMVGPSSLTAVVV